MIRVIAAAGLCITLVAGVAAPSSAQTPPTGGSRAFTFVAMGDIPYRVEGEDPRIAPAAQGPCK